MNRRKFATLLAILPLLTTLGAVTPMTNATAAEFFSGVWHTQYGDVVLTRNGNLVWGKYANRGLIVGTIGGVYGGANAAGPVKSFRGYFTHGPQHNFDANRHKPGCLLWRVALRNGGQKRIMDTEWRWPVATRWSKWQGGFKIEFSRHHLPSRQQIQQLYNGLKRRAGGCFN